jgi:Zn-dependent protease/predicted transcriptional regulator
MITRKARLFKLFGFQVSLDASWVFLLLLVTWSLATGFFPSRFTGLSRPTYWVMGTVAALTLFLSIILHELAHSLVARRHNVNIRGITLFVFGGVAQMEDEPSGPQAEFAMAIAGPLMSIALAVFFYSLSRLGEYLGLATGVFGVLRYLAIMNGMLAIFNLVPAFPLDGGRLLRSALWKKSGDLIRATRISSRVGSIFGIVLIALGVMNVLRGSFIGGMWWFLIGMFVSRAARSSYQQVLFRSTLEGQKIGRFMKTDIVSVTSATTVQELVDNYVYRYHHRMYPVMDNGNLKGCITTRQIKEIPRAQWAARTVGDYMQDCSADNMISLDTEARKVLNMMNQSGNSRLMVVEGQKLVGIVSLKDLLEYIAVKSELGEPEV